MSRKELLTRLRRARRDIDQATAEVQAEESGEVMDKKALKDITMAQARLRALEFRVDVIEGGS